MRADLLVVLGDSGLFPVPARNNSAHRIIVLFPLRVDLGGNERLEKDLRRHPLQLRCAAKTGHFFFFSLICSNSTVQEKYVRI